MKYVVDREASLLEFLEQTFPDSSKNTLRSWLKQERVTVNGKTSKLATLPLKKHQTIAIERSKQIIKGGISILYEDCDLVVVNKPEGVLSVATAFNTDNTVHAFLKDKYRPGRTYVVHRLDREASGVMVFARSVRACDGLKKLFEKHEIEREYCAIVEGVLSEKEGVWKSYLKEDDEYVVHSSEHSTSSGKLAITHYHVEETGNKLSKLRLRLETGRKNQIRVHCKEAGCPIVGDKKYGAKTNLAKRVCLHAYKLGFIHPITGKKMSFEIPLPESFSKIFRPKRRSI